MEAFVEEGAKARTKADLRKFGIVNMESFREYVSNPDEFARRYEAEAWSTISKRLV